MLTKKENDEKKRTQEKYREEFKEKFRQRITNGEVMDFT
jgi:uncharacterized protein YnzC (UPF0291/DUF896 family)